MRVSSLVPVFLLVSALSEVVTLHRASSDQQAETTDPSVKYSFKTVLHFLVRRKNRLSDTKTRVRERDDHSVEESNLRYIHWLFRMKSVIGFKNLLNKDVKQLRPKYSVGMRKSAAQSLKILQHGPFSWNRITNGDPPRYQTTRSTTPFGESQSAPEFHKNDHAENNIFNTTDLLTLIATKAPASADRNIDVKKANPAKGEQCLPNCSLETNTSPDANAIIMSSKARNGITVIIRIPLFELVALVSTAVAVPVVLAVLKTLRKHKHFSTSQTLADDEILIVDDFPLTPFNHLRIPVEGNHYQLDNCRTYSVTFNQTRINLSNSKLLKRKITGHVPIAVPSSENKTCQTLLRWCRDNPRYWLTLDPITLQSQCTPRLCGRNRIFIERDGLCHDVYDPNECKGGRRLYYTSFGDPICDCPLGQYPFPTAQDDCVSLFEQGPCPAEHVIDFAADGRLECTWNNCPSGTQNGYRLIPFKEDGFCYEFGTTGPCHQGTELFGYDVFERKGVCVSITDPSSSPYSPEENDVLDDNYDQLSPEYSAYRISLVEQNSHLNKNSAGNKVGHSSYELLKVPTSSSAILLNACRPGTQRELNYKCINPILPEHRRQEVLQAVTPAFSCPEEKVLQATGLCVNQSI